MKAFKREDEMRDGDMIAGVCYAAAAEGLIKRVFGLDVDNHYQPTVIGYLVEADNDEDELTVNSHWSEVDLDRQSALRNKGRLTDTELLELAAVERRLGYNVTE